MNLKVYWTKPELVESGNTQKFQKQIDLKDQICKQVEILQVDASFLKTLREVEETKIFGSKLDLSNEKEAVIDMQGWIDPFDTLQLEINIPDFVKDITGNHLVFL